MEYSDIEGREPVIAVGILCSEKIEFSFNGSYMANDETYEGTHEVCLVNGHLAIDGKEILKVTFKPVGESTFNLHDVVIGIGFHWQRNEVQTFSGELSFVVDGGKVWAVNRLPIEDYLYCVIASEMSATSSVELLKAHAVVSRSWLVAQLLRKNDKSHIEYRTDEELVKWYDRDDHRLFDVCADDHCQRYQGLTRIPEFQASKEDVGLTGYTDKINSAYEAAVAKIHSWIGDADTENKTPVRRAIDETRGLLLMSDGEVCDARFSKCCGGVTETYDTCWDNSEHRYLQTFVDYTHVPSGYEIDLSVDANAVKWIRENPDAFCNTQDATILRQVLNTYDQETADFYRWKVEYGVDELSALVAKKTGIDFGQIVDLQPIERGKSGRISRLRIVGTKRSLIIGKELEIRRSLSESHLYSSAFVVEKKDGKFVLTGAGWGHGVGMCQIGAAVMSDRGFGFKSILLHYFRCATIKKKW